MPGNDTTREGGNGGARPDGHTRKVKLCELWQRRSASGNIYLTGYWGDLSLVAFAEERKHPRTGELLIVWKLLAEERDPSRRPGGGAR